MNRSPLPPETPRVEPEIIPPNRKHGGADADWSQWNDAGGYGTQRIYVAKLGPWRILMIVAVFGFVVAIALAILLGAMVLALPVLLLLIVAAVVANFFRPRLRQPR